MVTGNNNSAQVKNLISDILNKDWMGVTHVDFKLIQTYFEDSNYYNVAVYFQNTNKELFYHYSCILSTRLQQALSDFQNKKEAAVMDVWTTTL